MEKQSAILSMRQPRTPEVRRALWRSIQAIWKQRKTGEVTAELEKIRRAWDRELP
jgi:hypothetical protein